MAVSSPPPRPLHRIAKLLARAGVASRRDVERMIEEGRVAVGGTAIATPATLLASLHDVTVDGQPVAAAEPARLFLFHKPSGVLTTERDPRGRRTIYDVLPRDLPRLVPVGRLDLATEGLLLLTTDGGLKRELELPSTGVERAYRARAYGQVSQPQLEELIDGVEIDGVRYGSIDANIERRTGANLWVEMILTEGKNREVRRVLEHLGLQVSRLIRTRYGPFVLGDLPAGGIGEVRAADLAGFRQTLAKAGGKAASEGAVAVRSDARRGEARRVPTDAAPPPGERPHRSGARAAAPRKVGSASTRPARVAPADGAVAPAERPLRSGARAAPARTTASHAPRPTPAADRKGPFRAAPPAATPRPAPAADRKAADAPTAADPPQPFKRKAGWAKPKPRPDARRPRSGPRK